MSIESIAKAGWHLISPNCTRMNGQKKKVNVRQQLLPRLSALHVGDAAAHAIEAERQSYGGVFGFAAKGAESWVRRRGQAPSSAPTSPMGEAPLHPGAFQ